MEPPERAIRAGHLATVERHLRDCLLVDGLFEGDIFRLQGQTTCLYLNLLVCPSNRHSNVNRNVASNLKNDL